MAALAEALSLGESLRTSPDNTKTAAKAQALSVGDKPEQPVQPVLSKTAQKKLAKKERFAANKAAAKAAEKAAKQADTARRREEVQQKFATMTEEERNVWRSERQAKRQNRKSETGDKRARLEQAMTEGQSIIIDCDFEEQMTETEIKSLCGQLQYCYSSNIRAAKPCHLSFTSLKGAVAQQAQHQLSGLENWYITKTANPYLEAYQGQREQLVYLTADSPDELSELDPTKRYIIGGIVDRNRHKNICFRKAEAQGLKTARLPIGAYMKLASSHVLTVNHVVDILLSWLELRDWQQAFFKVIPTRKRVAGSGSDATADAAQGDRTADATADALTEEVQATQEATDLATSSEGTQQSAQQESGTDIGAMADRQTAEHVDFPVLATVDHPNSKRLKADSKP